MKGLKITTGLMVLTTILFMGCGGQNSDGDTSKNSQGLSEFEIENGIGPITEEITIGEIDEELAKKGEELFETKCSACHKMNSRYVGPPLGNILQSRTPTYLMNMILNPEEMVKKHPVGKELLKEYMTPMPNQNLSQEEARSVVEYLASESQTE